MVYCCVFWYPPSLTDSQYLHVFYVLASKIPQMWIKMRYQRDEALQRLFKHCILISSHFLYDFCCKTLCFTKLTQDLLSHIYVKMKGSFFHSLYLYCCCSISVYYFLDYLSLCKLAGEISLQLALTCFLSLGPSGQSNETNSKKTNRNLTGTTYHWSVILRINFSVVSNSAKRDANGFFKALSLSSYLWIRDILSENQSLVHKQ